LLASSQHNLYDTYLLPCVQCYTPDDGQRNCPKHVESQSKNKFEKLVHHVAFIIRKYNMCFSFLYKFCPKHFSLWLVLRVVLEMIGEEVRVRGTLLPTDFNQNW